MQEEPEGPPLYPAEKKAVDSYVIILACVLGGLLALPLLVWLVRICLRAHQRRKVGAVGLVWSSLVGGRVGTG